MIVKIGNYFLPNSQTNLVSHNKRVVFGPRGKALYRVEDLTITGFVKGSTPEMIGTLVNQVEIGSNVLATAAVGLYYDSGQPTPNVINGAVSRSGLQVTEFSYPEGNAAEYATQRNFRIGVRAEFDIALGEILVDYTEVVSIRGNGGSRSVVHEFTAGVPEIEQVQSQSAVSVIQQGTATGYSAYPAPNPPLATPGLIEQGPSRSVSYKSPQATGTGFRNYSVQWSYEFLAVGAVNALPTAK